MRRPEHEVRGAVVEASRTIWDRGWVANHDGNITARVSPGRFVATPTALSKRVIDRDMLIVVDEAGVKVQGRLRPFSELGLHLTVYRARPDVSAVLHAHPPHATARAVVGRPLPCFLAEAVVSMGVEIPLVPLAAPGAAAERALAPFVDAHDGVLLGGHGVLTWGDDVEQAFLRMELVEHLARIAAIAEPQGGVRPLPAEVVTELLAARKRAGLGPEARATTRRTGT